MWEGVLACGRECWHVGGNAVLENKMLPQCKENVAVVEGILPKENGMWAYKGPVEGYVALEA